MSGIPEKDKLLLEEGSVGIVYNKARSGFCSTEYRNLKTGAGVIIGPNGETLGFTVQPDSPAANDVGLIRTSVKKFISGR